MIGTYIVYNLILLAVFLFSLLAEFSKSIRVRGIARLFVFLTLWIPAAIRYQVGVDFDTYTLWYFHPELMYKVEPGYFYLAEFLHGLDCHVQCLFIITSFIMYFPISFYMKRKGYCMIMTFYVLIYYFISLCYIRQAISVSLIMCAMMYWFEKKKTKFFLCMILATMFHYSTLIVLPLFFLNKCPSKIICYCLVLMLFFLLKRINLSDLIFNNFIISNTKYGTYATMSINRATDIGTGIGLLIRLVITCSVIFLSDKLNDYAEKKYIVNFSMAYIGASFLAMQIVILARIRDILYFVPILFVPCLFRLKIRYSKFYFILICLLHLAVFEKEIAANQRNWIGTLELSPYTSLFDK